MTPRLYPNVNPEPMETAKTTNTRWGVILEVLWKLATRCNAEATLLWGVKTSVGGSVSSAADIVMLDVNFVPTSSKVSQDVTETHRVVSIIPTVQVLHN